MGDKQFPATAVGYRALLAWLRSFGRVVKVGMEGTGTYGAGLARCLTAEGIDLVEVDRPDRRTRQVQGKSDTTDAIAAARVIPARCTIRWWTSTTNRTYRRVRPTVSTVKKSHASSPRAWAVRN